MPGNKIGGKKASITNKKRYGDDFYKKIGHSGGLISRGGGFKPGSQLAIESGRKGGKASRRPKDNMAAYFAPRFVDESEVEND